MGIFSLLAISLILVMALAAFSAFYVPPSLDESLIDDKTLLDENGWEYHQDGIYVNGPNAGRSKLDMVVKTEPSKDSIRIVRF